MSPPAPYIWGTAQGRIAGLEEQLKLYKELLKEAKEELKEERRRGEAAVAREMERADKQLRTLFDVRAFGPNEPRRSGFDSRRVVSG